MRKVSKFDVSALIRVFRLLYVRFWLLVLFSLNESRWVTVWAGVATKWYVELM